MMKKIYFACFLAIFTSISSMAAEPAAPSPKPLTDANISGHVVDASTHEHLPFVSIQIKGTQIGGTSDESGHYFLSNLPVGTYTLVFSMVGYESMEQKIELKSNTTQELNVELVEGSIMMENVVVTSSRYETKQKQAVTMVNVVSPQLFKTTTSCCVSQVLDYQTGLRTETNCHNCGTNTLRINGLGGEYSQILIDSRPIFSSLAAVYGLEQIPSAMVDRIEVIRGGGSALFGANAVGGVVNIITKDPVHNFFNVENTSSFMGDKKPSYDINTSINGSLVSKDAKMGVYMFGVHRNRSGYDRDKDGFSEIPELNNTTAGFRSFFKLGKYSKLVAEYHHIYEYRRGGNDRHKPAHETDIAEQLRHNIDAGSLKYDFFSLDNRHYFSLYTSAQYIKRESYYGTKKDPNAYGESSNVTACVGAQYRLEWMRKTWIPANFTIGSEYTFDQLKDRVLSYNRDVNQKVHLYGGYIQNEWKNDMLSLLVGGRLEKHSLLKKPIFSPRASIRYTPIQNVILRANYASGYRAPQVFDEDLHVGMVGGEVSLIDMDPNLKPEYSHSVSGSIDLYKNWKDVQTNLTLEGFYTRLNDVFLLKENGHDADGNLHLLRTNGKGAWVGGLNVEAKLAWKRYIMLQLGYTYQQSRYVEPITWSENKNIAPQKRMFRTPDSYGYMILSSEPVKGLNISLTGKYTGRMLVQHFAGYVGEDEEVETPRFWDMGMKISYAIPIYKYYSLEISAGIKNMLDSYQKDIDKGVERDAGYIYGPLLPRTYFVGLNLKI